jgi:hypothetical protein
LSLLVGSSLVMFAACAPAPEEEEEEEEEEESRPATVMQEERAQPTALDPARELFINDVSVVDDALFSGAFGQLIANMVPERLSSPLGRSQFVLRWLKTWESEQTVNHLVIPARPLIRSLIIDPWRTASGCTCGDDSCVLDFSKAPFRLLAVVNRPDLRRIPRGRDPGQAGQGRFIFGALGPLGQRMPFTVIFEYQLPISRRGDILRWAERWHALSNIAFGSSYNERLKAVTYEFTKRNAVSCQVNGSALLQLRTNEISLSPVVPKLWEMREFVLGPGGNLRPTTVKQEVDASLNGSARLGTWVGQNAAAILANRHVVPRTLQGQPFLAAASPVPSDLAWEVPGVSEELRHAFALATCSGCHKSETETSFLQVRTREVGSASVLSPFVIQELSPTGPRVMDFRGLLSLPDGDRVQNGLGKDHPEDRYEED